MLQIETGATVFSTARPSMPATYLGMLCDENSKPLAARVVFSADGEYYVGAASLFATQKEARDEMERIRAADLDAITSATPTPSTPVARRQQRKLAA